MKTTKSALIVIVVSLAFLKLLDVAFYKFANEKYYAEPLRKKTDRSIVLREYGPNQQRIYDPTNTYTLAGVDRKIGRYVFRIDQNGFIRTGNAVLPDPELKVLFLGGSTTETMLVEERNRFPSVVERALRTDLGRPANIFNGGVSGNNSMHSLTKFVAKGIPLKPDFAIMMHNVNDLHALSKSGSYWATPEITNLVVQNYEANILKRFVFSTFRAVKNALIPNLYGYLKPRLMINYFTPTHVDGAQTIKDRGFDRLDIETQWRSSLISFVRVAKTWNIKPILMTQFNRYHMEDPYFRQWHVDRPGIDQDPLEFVEVYARFNDIIREVSESERVPLIELAKVVPPDKDHIYDTVHLTDKGSILVGNIIVEKLKTLLK